MATTIFYLDLFNAHPEYKDLLTREEVRQFCKHHNQHTSELDEFLTQFEFEQWACVGLSIYAHYYEHTKDGELDCSAAAFLGIILTSLGSNKYELAFKNYLKKYPINGHGFDLTKNVYDENSVLIQKRKDFNIVKNCPLWVVKIDKFSPYSLSGIVLIPTEFYNETELVHHSAGYAYYINDRGWYRYDEWIDYRMKRVGSWSPNFLNVTTNIFESNQYHLYDDEKNRLFRVPYYGRDNAIEYYDLDKYTLEKVEGIKISDLCIKDNCYHFYTKKGITKTNKDFEILEKQSNKTGLMGNRVFQEYEGKGWKVTVTNKGFHIRLGNVEIKERLSTFKITSSGASSKDLLIFALDENHLALLNDQLIIVNSDMEITIHSLKKKFKKELEPWVGQKIPFYNPPTNGVDIGTSQSLLFAKNFVVSVDEHQEPVFMNTKLFEITGEFVFYSAVADIELDGIWLLAGLERLVFVNNTLSQGFVFNTEAVGSLGSGDYPKPWLHINKKGDLWFTLNSEKGICKIERKELMEKLKVAIPYKK